MPQWQTWNGGICPVDTDATVFYIIRASGQKAMRSQAGLLRWDHGRTPDSAAETYRPNDIIAYKICEDPYD